MSRDQNWGAVGTIVGCLTLCVTIGTLAADGLRGGAATRTTLIEVSEHVRLLATEEENHTRQLERVQTELTMLGNQLGVRMPEEHAEIMP